MTLRRHLPPRLLLACARGDTHALAASAAAHARACARCGHDIRMLHAADTHLDELFAAFTTPPPPVLQLDRAAARGARASVRRSRVVLALAASVLLALTVPQVRALLRDQLFSRAAEDVVPTPAPLRSSHPDVRVAIPAAGARVEIRLTHAQSGGVLTIQFGTAGEVTLRVSDATGAEEITASTRGFRIVNASGTPSYTLTIPRSVQTVELTIAGSTIPVLLDDDGFRYELARR